MFQSTNGAGLGVHDVVGRQAAGEQDHRGHRQARARPRRRPSGPCPHRAEQRVLRARRPARQHHAVDGDGGQGQEEQDPDRAVGHLQEGVVAEDRDHARRRRR